MALLICYYNENPIPNEEFAEKLNSTLNQYGFILDGYGESPEGIGYVVSVQKDVIYHADLHNVLKILNPDNYAIVNDTPPKKSKKK